MLLVVLNRSLQETCIICLRNVVRKAYTSQSTANNKNTSWSGMSIAVRTIKISTRAALGTLAEEKDAAVDVKLRKNKHKSWLEPIICLPNSDEFSHPQRNTVSLGKKYGRHRNEQGSTVHVNIASDRKNESRDSGVDLELIFHEGER
jgi:hypothetical protein